MQNTSSSSSNTVFFRWIKYKKQPSLEAKPTGFFSELIYNFKAKPFRILHGLAVGLYEEPRINQSCDGIDRGVYLFERFKRLYGPPILLLLLQIGFIIGLRIIVGIELINRKLTPAKRFLIGGLGLVCYVVRRWFALRKGLLGGGEGGKKNDGGGPAGGLAV